MSDYAYSGFDVFIDRLRFIVSSAEQVLGRRDVNRVGYRKIDSILLEPVASYFDACSIFNPSLFGLLRSGLAVTDSLTASEEVVILDRDGKVCNLKHRLKKLEKANSFEANLDYDLVDKTGQTIDTALGQTLPEMNNIHFDLFMWAVTPDFVKIMES